ncbi:MAG TPA: aldehyde dehydrogenase family protein [Frankiaceae bacterium]|jgi:aldehyde dehydrogenase (NAD+)|nr:aldehyde dehydrogenase family protein [Frankiaceae bacterium]
MTDTQTRPAVHLRIAGQKIATGSRGVHDHIDPSTGQVDAQIPLAGKAEVDQAVAAAHDAFQTWRRTPAGERRALLLRLADLIEANAEEFGRRGTMDNGTPSSVVGGMAQPAVEWTRYYAGWADKISGELSTSFASAGEMNYTLMQPYGVIGIIITWNGPLISLAMKIPAALAAGNTVVVKPSELTPFSAELYMDLVEQAGIPAGVVNVLPGSPEAGEALVTHPLVQKVTFTGGPATAKKILHACAEQMKPTVLELGGKSANIIFDDADLDTACGHGTFMSVGLLSGQGCAFPTRMLVQESIYEDVVARTAMVAKNISVGDPWDPATMAGPVVNKDALERILGMIERAKLDGARLVTGGARLEGDLARGYFIEPTVFADVDPDSELAQTEVFGPVLAITPFATDDEAIRIANSTRYGLSGYIQTTNLQRALRVSEELITGEVLVNGAANLRVQRPFGGLGLSGLGKEGGKLGFEEFLRVKSVGIA